MLDLDALLNPVDYEPALDLSFLNSLSIETFNVDTYIKALRSDYISVETFEQVLEFVYINDLDDVSLFNAILRHSTNPVSSLSYVYYVVNQFYTDPEFKIDYQVFAEHMSQLDPSKNGIKFILDCIWQDLDLAINLTNSANIDPYVSPQVVLLSISLWWPKYIEYIAGLSAIYEDSELSSFFFEALHMNNAHSIIDVSNIIQELFI